MRRNWFTFGAMAMIALGAAGLGSADDLGSRSNGSHLSIDIHVPRGMSGRATGPRPFSPQGASVNVDRGRQGQISTQGYPPGSIYIGNSLPLWTFDIQGSRDGEHHQGVAVGRDPFRNPGTSRVPTYIVPLIVRTHTIATGVNSSTLYLSTEAGDTTIDPTQADKKCMSAPNNVPVRVLAQSPLFNAPPKPFVFNGVSVGATQYVDAFQRSEFWKVLSRREDEGNAYHLLLSPVTVLQPIVIDVPATAGIALTDPNLFKAAFGFSYCAPIMLVDGGWFDSYLNGTVLPQLEYQGINPGTFPIFVAYNVAVSGPDVTFLGNCCAIGYHSLSGVPLPAQTYAFVDYDTSDFFAPSANAGSSPGLNTSVAAHEIGEWANDPYGTNETAPWGGTGQVSSCQANFEVGDPLSGTDVPAVTMRNGYSYSLQEMAYFSWFYGGPSLGAGGVFSNNGSFTADAGPNCPSHNL